MPQAVLEIATSKFYRRQCRCIYCRRKAVQLNDEHIIPFGLAGNALVLRQVSCFKCANETEKYETRVLRHMWWPFRTHIGAPTRRRRQVPNDFTMKRSEPGAVVDGRASPTVNLIEQVPTEEYPLFFYTLLFGPP